MWLATKNDALSADAFDDMMAFSNCFCFSYFHVYLLTLKPFTIGEELILPPAKDICLELLREAAEKVALVPLPASTINRLIY